MVLTAQRDEEAPSAFQIESHASFSERRPRTLKHGYTFAVFDRRGDVSPGTADGLYHHDTRHLSRLELRIDGAEPLLLSSNVQDNGLLAVDLTNPDPPERSQSELRGQLIHIGRRKFVWEGACYERLLVRNFDVAAHDVRLSLAFAADFADLFEVRGEKRKRRGRTSAECRSDSTVLLRYAGLDGIERLTGLCFAPVPSRLDTGAAEFDLALAPGAEARISLRIGCEDPVLADEAARPFAGAMLRSWRQLRRSSARAASLDSSNSLFNEMARRSVADLYMLITDTAQGPY